VDYLTIIEYASDAFPAAHLELSTGTWLKGLSGSRNEASRNSHQIATLLVLLSAAIQNQHQIPPFLSVPHMQYFLHEPLERKNIILALENVDQPGFRPFVAIEVAHMGLNNAVERLIILIRELVGEIDFSYTVDTHLPEGLE
jgi:hypothetical protein